MLTTDVSGIYWKPPKPYITIQNINKTSPIYYSYNGLLNQVGVGPASMIPVYCRVNMGTDHHGTFEVQFDCSTSTPPFGIMNGNRCLIQMSKDASLPAPNPVTLLSGFIRKTGYTRGQGGEALFTIEGSGTSIRMNERITYLVKEATKNADGTPNQSDATMKANALLTTLITTDVSDSFTHTANEMTSNYETTGLPGSSDVENFIPSISVEFGEYQDGINALEDQSNGEFFIDPNDVARFRHQLQGYAGGRGFILKDTQGTDDNADITGYISPNSPPNFMESKYKSDGYSSRVWAILPADPRPTNNEELHLGLNTDLTPAAWSFTKKGEEYAYPFRPTHSHYIPGDICIIGNVFTSIPTGSTSPPFPVDSPPPTVKFRICKDAGGFPMNANGVVANVLFHGQFDDAIGPPAPAGGPTQMTLLNQQHFVNTAAGNGSKINSFDLDTSKTYWLISSDDAFSQDSQKAHRFAWGLDDSVAPSSGGMFHRDSSRGGTATMSGQGFGGSEWTGPLINKPCFALGTYRSQSFLGWDPKAIEATGTGVPNAHVAGSPTTGTMIESTLSIAPSMIRTKQAMAKYMTSSLYYMARPRINWSTVSVSPPNIPILPNDPLMIVDTTLNFSTPGRQVMVATTGDMTYEFGTRGGTGNVYSANLSLSIQPAGIANHY